MHALPQEKSLARNKRRVRISIAVIALIVLAAGIWKWNGQGITKTAKLTSAVQVVSAPVTRANVLVKLTSNGTVSALQSIDVRPQISAMVKTVHVKEGQFVHKGDRLFSFDSRIEDANLKKSEAQVAKDRTDLTNAERNLERVKALFKLEYVAQSELDAAQNSVDDIRAQLAIDLSTVEANRVARSFDEIAAPINGRIGAISVYPGNLVQPSAMTALVSIAQLDPINVRFALPERELAGLQQALAKGVVSVSATLSDTVQNTLKGHLVFIDNAVDTASGTIHLKAVFANAEHILWPGMFVNVMLAPRTLMDVLTVPAQAVQMGPEKKFLYVIGSDNKVSSVSINVILIQDNLAVIEGVAIGDRIVVEGTQNLRPGSVVSEAGKETQGTKGSQNKYQDAAKLHRAGKP